ncbi:hypothetical protein AQUCO_00800124v1 [Aquilegia coerulea]|uniref:poly(A)-specific ribonuclease n=1 Tax=Aquilegia coerulea TaxID=218851 RepID=A0A2G5EHC5_AQUCA|nr:hypothetical protein AQUCO_00800124v1 [Aquilegia coerulea]
MAGTEFVQMRSGFSVNFEKSNIPVVGIELNPFVEGAREESLRFTWYRLLNDQKVKCCVHKLKDATFQCMSCVKLNLPVKESYHCSMNCYNDAWNYHRQRHHEAFMMLGRRLNVQDEYKDDLLPDRKEIMVDQDGKSWLRVGCFKNYVPSRDDFGCILRLETVLVDCSLRSTPHVLVTDRVIVAPPAPRPRCIIPVMPLMGSSIYAQHSAHQSFRVLSYNVLADMCATRDKFSYCPSWALTWEYRKQNLLREIIGYEAEIICLQEVQLEHFENFFKPELEQRGYSVMFMRKQGGLYMRGGYKYDGCATFFRCNRFREVRGYQLVFKEIARAVIETLQPNQKETGIRLLKDNVAIVTILESLENKTVSCNLNSIFCVANTHIHASEEFKDVKLWQVATLVNGLEMIGKLGIPILICGDLNSRPGSAPYDLLLCGKVDSQHVEWPNDPVGIFNHLKLFHGLPLGSAYRSLQITDGSHPFFEKQRKKTNFMTGEPWFTNFSNAFSGTLDYIFYSGDKLQLKGLLELLDPGDISKNTGLPSPDWSSDHIALMAEFCLMPQPKVNCPLPERLW